MRFIGSVLFCVVSVLSFPLNAAVQAQQCSPLLDFEFQQLNDETQVNLCKVYQGQVIMIVNTASRCAYTDQYDSLEKLYKQYRNSGFVVLGFPSNDFGQQEPGSEAQIRDFCRLTYGVEFPMFEKTHAAQLNAHPLFHALGKAAGRYPGWNFHKYLIGRDGQLVRDFSSSIDPAQLQVRKVIEAELQK
jgi:glutathione peroxidase